VPKHHYMAIIKVECACSNFSSRRILPGKTTGRHIGTLSAGTVKECTNSFSFATADPNGTNETCSPVGTTAH